MFISNQVIGVCVSTKNIDNFPSNIRDLGVKILSLRQFEIVRAMVVDVKELLNSSTEDTLYIKVVNPLLSTKQ